MNEAKSALRKQVRMQAAEMTQEQRDASDAQLVQRLLDHPAYQSANRIFLYIGVRNEIRTLSMVENLYHMGKMIALPVSGANGEMEFYLYDGRMRTGRFGIPEPMSEQRVTPTEDDLLIVPGLAFDCSGRRLGQGGGYYDRYMARYPCRTVGLCRAAFLMEEIPVAWNDLSVDIVITEYAEYIC